MKTERRKYAKYALIFAGVAALTSLVLGLIYQNFSLPVQIGLGLTALGLAGAIILDPGALKQLMSGRQAKYGSNTLVLTVAVLGILVIVNLVGYNNTVRWDLTEDKTNSLADETQAVLDSLNINVKAEAYFSMLMSRETANTLLQNYKANSDGKFDYEFIDPNENPLAADEAGITRDGSIVLRAGTAKEVVTFVNEEEITSAILRLKSPETKRIYVLTGHGEPEFTGNEALNYATAARELEAKNYSINTLNLLASNSIPDDAQVLLITGPQKPLSQNEVDLIETFIAQGGSLLVMYEPSILTEFGEQEDPLATYLSETWNIGFGDDMVIDITANPVTTAVAANFGSHPVTEKLNSMVSVLPTSRSLVIGTSSGFAPSMLVATTDQSWAETNFEALQNNEVGYDEGADQLGPINLALAAEDTNTGSRVIAFGDSEFPNNAQYQYYGNSDLFLNTIDWLSGQDEMISLTARTQTTRILVPPNRYVQNAILLGSVVLIPALIIMAAIIVFVKRHREV